VDNHIFDHLQNPIFIVSTSGEIKYYNFVCSLFFKLPPRKLGAIKNIIDLINPVDYDLVLDLKKCIESKTPIVSPEVDIKINGHTNTIILKAIPHNDYVLVHLQDFSIEKKLHEKYKNQILELKSTHEQIVKSDKLRALGELIAGISHEISSPLTVAGDTLLSLAENLHQKNYPQVEVELTELEVEFTRIRQIVSNMQSMAKNRDEDISVISLREAIEDSLSFIKELGLLEDTKIIRDFSNSLVLGNTGKLQQVFINILKNAIDAISHNDNKQINIMIEEHDQSVFIHIKDNGVGIKPGEAQKLFEMFYTTKEVGNGTGLGLSISQQIVTSFHGNISIVDSTDGAHFCIEFPNIDLESFTSTNRYLTGECEIEELDLVFKHFAQGKVILILSNQADQFEEICDSYMADHALSFSKEVSTNLADYTCVDGKSADEVIKIIKEAIRV
jgi:signal transduction histidine kinase